MGAGGGKGGSARIQVSDYFLSMHIAVCRGPVDEINAVYFNDKKASSWGAAATANTTKTLNNKGLFGGRKQGGGVAGLVDVLLGGAEQLLTISAAARLVVGASPLEVPAFRGLCSLFFRGSDTVDPVNFLFTSRKGFLWGSNNPSVPNVAVTVTRKPRGLDSNNMIGTDANPAHMIYECLTNDEWGMGATDALIDRDSFLLAAETLRDEEFGLSMLWTNQSTIEEFVGEILDHINGAIALNPKTGLFFLKLLRKDYDVETLRELNPSNCTLKDLQRKGWGETVNEVVVTWTNPENEEEETVTSHDQANIAIQGYVVSDSRNYYGVRNKELATRLAERDIQNSSLPLAAAVVECDRSMWDVLPGDVLKFVWPEEGIEQIIVRVGQVDYGKPGNPAITLSIVEDVFGFADAAYGTQASQWTDPAAEVEPLAFSMLTVAPYYVLARAFGDLRAQELVVPDAFTMIFGASDQEDIQTVDYLTEVTDPVGNLTYQFSGSIDRQGHGYLTSSLPGDVVESDLYPIDDYIGDLPQVGWLVVIVNPIDDHHHEICAIEAVSGTSIFVRRGVLDTVPEAWAAGTPVWLVDTNKRMFDKNLRTDATVVNYKFLPRTSIAQLPEDLAPIETTSLGLRLHRPLRPANIAVNGVAFGVAGFTSLDTQVVVTWANRNRLTETSQVLRWDDSDVTKEVGQTTTVQLLDSDGVTVLATTTGLTGASYNIPIASFGTVTAGKIYWVKIWSMRDGVASRSTITRQLIASVPAVPTGYGRVYGQLYGQ